MMSTIVVSCLSPLGNNDCFRHQIARNILVLGAISPLGMFQTVFAVRTGKHMKDGIILNLWDFLSKLLERSCPAALTAADPCHKKVSVIFKSMLGSLGIAYQHSGEICRFLDKYLLIYSLYLHTYCWCPINNICRQCGNIGYINNKYCTIIQQILPPYLYPA